MRVAPQRSDENNTFFDLLRNAAYATEQRTASSEDERGASACLRTTGHQQRAGQACHAVHTYTRMRPARPRFKIRPTNQSSSWPAAAAL
jgi:hypothetical protein